MMKLYHSKTSVCSAKVRICLSETGCNWSGHVLDLANGPQNAEWYLALNPKAVVPTLVDGAFSITESTVILQYLVQKYRNEDLLPHDPVQRTRVLMWLADCRDIHAAINTLTYATEKRRKVLASKTPDEISASLKIMANPANAAKRKDLLANGIESSHVDAAIFALRLMFKKMRSNLSLYNWLEGDYSLADTAILPYVDRLDRLGLYGLWTTAPEVGDWLERSRDRPSYADAVVAFAGPAKLERETPTSQENWTLVSDKWSRMSTRSKN